MHLSMHGGTQLTVPLHQPPPLLLFLQRLSKRRTKRSQRVGHAARCCAAICRLLHGGTPGVPALLAADNGSLRCERVKVETVQMLSAIMQQYFTYNLFVATTCEDWFFGCDW